MQGNQGIPNSELRATLMPLRPSLWVVAGLSAAINFLALGSSIYMMMVYDRVLPSGSTATLFGLLGIFAVVFVFHGILDVLRAQILSDIGRSFSQRLSPRLQQLQWRTAPAGNAATRPLHDIDQIKGFLSGSGPAALIDLPWIFFFLAILFLMHVWLGVTTLVGIFILAGVTLFTERRTARNLALLEPLRQERAILQDRNNRSAITLKGLGMTGRASAQWELADRKFSDVSSRVTEFISLSGGGGRIFRIFLQSAVLSVGALLVIDGQASGGIIFAGSILAGRALAPMDQAIANWRGFVGARQSWARLDRLMADNPPAEEKTVQLPAPKDRLAVERLTVAPPLSNIVTLAEVGFEAEAGDVIGILGPSGSGKSTLIKALAGLWKPLRGSVRLDGAAMNQWQEDDLGLHLGYLPQEVGLMQGTIAENIARLQPQPDSGAILRAAKQAGVHDMIVAMPDGYETQIGLEGQNLSAGQRQRVALARALFGDPFLLLLDEPNSNLDPEGEAALVAAIEYARKRGAIILLVTHQMQILRTVSKILLLRGGKLAGWGPRDQILSALAEQAKKKPADSGLKVVN
jgi:PrtD family type I secretion system ABC transporter